MSRRRSAWRVTDFGPTRQFAISWKIQGIRKFGLRGIHLAGREGDTVSLHDVTLRHDVAFGDVALYTIAGKVYPGYTFAAPRFSTSPSAVLAVGPVKNRLRNSDVQGGRPRPRFLFAGQLIPGRQANLRFSRKSDNSDFGDNSLGGGVQLRSATLSEVAVGWSGRGSAKNGVRSSGVQTDRPGSRSRGRSDLRPGRIRPTGGFAASQEIREIPGRIGFRDFCDNSHGGVTSSRRRCLVVWWIFGQNGGRNSDAQSGRPGPRSRRRSADRADGRIFWLSGKFVKSGNSGISRFLRQFAWRGYKFARPYFSTPLSGGLVDIWSKRGPELGGPVGPAEVSGAAG